MVLVEPQGGSNVGGVCRAIKNMEAGRLVTVAARYDAEEARRMAVHAGDILAEAVDVATIDEAVAGCGLVVGTSDRTEALRGRTAPLSEVARAMAEWEQAQEGADAEFALVFGPEDRGLSNSEMAHCHRLLYVETGEAYTSLNLAGAVLLCAHQLRLARGAVRSDPPSRPVDAPAVERGSDDALAADAGEVAAMLEGLEAALVEIGYLAEDHPGHVMAGFRSLLTRTGLDRRELRMLRGLVRQIRWFADGGREVARDKRERGQRLR